MKVLVHLNHGIDKSYMLNFGESMTRERLRRIARMDSKRSVRLLIARSKSIVEVSAEQKQKAKSLADFIVSQQGYTAERLA